VKLESQIIESSGDQVTELSNGCMCCVVRGDLIRTVDGLLEKRPDIGHIILEASGLSDPVPIANTFLNDEMGGRVHFDSVVCVVDPVNFLSSLDDYPVAEAQLLYSDFILLSKVDVASASQVDAARNLILSRRRDARILEIGEGFPLDLVFDTSRVDHSKLAGLEMEEERHRGHGDNEGGGKSGIVAGADGKSHYRHVHESVDTLFYKSQRPLDLERFGAVMHRLPREVVRAKGFLDFADPEARGKKFVLQLVGGRPVLSAKPWEPGEARQSAMVFIGRGFDREKLLASLNACELEPVSPGRVPAKR